MKLVISIVHDDFAGEVINALTEKEYRVTKLATTGGFLRTGNTTLLMGVKKEAVDDVISIIKEICETRTQIISSPLPISSAAGMYTPYPIEVEVGGATIFVVDVDKYVKV